MSEKDIIAAISTPLGEGGIGIVRLSGEGAFDICQKVFKDSKPSQLSDRPNHTIHYGFIVDPKSKEQLDEVMVSIHISPHSYTTEDMVEINAHGGVLVVQRILLLILREGARLAEPGEFTKRAFLNGRMDLTQAEAVVDLIRSKTDLAERCAIQQLTGKFSKELKEISNTLLDVLAELEAHIDFPEEGLPDENSKSMMIRIQESQKKIQELLKSAKFGQAVREGVRTTIIGKPNVGKSSLLNALLEEERAIVTPLPGTTRDTITEGVNIGGIPFLFTDTAGWRDTSDIVEKEGVKRTQKAISNSDFILLVLDGSDELTHEDKRIINETQKLISSQNNKKKMVTVLNKMDLPQKISLEELSNEMYQVPMIPLSALTGQGLDIFKEKLLDTIREGNITDSTTGIMVTNIRHAELLQKSELTLKQVIEGFQQKQEPECISTDLREALHLLGEITGQNISTDLLERIFSRFCIGK